MPPLNMPPLNMPPKPRLYVVFALLSVLSVAPVANAASPLKAARACAARADSACVVRLLKTAKPSLVQAPEHWLSLAFAQSRLGQHGAAQAAFRTWLGLSPTRRLDRGQMPARIWPDYVAALLAHHGGALDLEPRVTRTPGPVVVAGSWRDLPVILPPPRSTRDSNRDTEFVLGPEVGKRLGLDGVAVGLSLLMRFRISSRLRLGLGAVAMSAPVAPGVRDVIGVLGVRGAWVVSQRASGRLSIAALAGGGLNQGRSSSSVIDPLLAPSLRYAWLPAGAALGVEASLSDRVVFGATTTQTIVVGLALLLHPGKRSGEAR